MDNRTIEELQNQIDMLAIILFGYIESNSPGAREAILESPLIQEDENFKRWLQR